MSDDIYRIQCLREKIINLVEMGLSMPVDSLDAEELGELVDMIKDLAEAEHHLCGYSETVGIRYEDDYETARRHYHETRSIDDKQMMEDRAEEHVQKAIRDLREIWSDADPTMRQKIKNNVSTLMNEMK